MGVRLLTRTTRSVAPTEAGERLLQSLAPRIDEIEAEIAALMALRDKPSGTVRITLSDHASRPSSGQSCGRSWRLPRHQASSFSLRQRLPQHRRGALRCRRAPGRERRQGHDRRAASGRTGAWWPWHRRPTSQRIPRPSIPQDLSGTTASTCARRPPEAFMPGSSRRTGGNSASGWRGSSPSTTPTP